MTPRLGWLLAILWASSLLWAYHFADRNARNAYEAAKVPVLVQSIEKHNERAVAGQAVETKASAKQAKTEAKFQKLDSEVLHYAQEHPIATDCSIDAGGLRTWRDANRATETAGAGQLDEGLWRSAAAGQWEDPRPPGQPRDGGQDVSQVPRADARAWRMDGANP